jgi:hypothetical protein
MLLICDRNGTKISTVAKGQSLDEAFNLLRECLLKYRDQVNKCFEGLGI